MNVFLDSSVVIAACASARGASRAIFDGAANNQWTLLASSFVISEIDSNLDRLSSEGARQAIFCNESARREGSVGRHKSEATRPIFADSRSSWRRTLSPGLQLL